MATKKRSQTNIKEFSDFERKLLKEKIQHMDTKIAAAGYLKHVAELQIELANVEKAHLQQQLLTLQEKLNGTS